MIVNIHLFIKLENNTIKEIYIFERLKDAKESYFVISYNCYLYRKLGFSNNRRAYI